MHIVLHEPEIPANTGNIGRSCVATGTSLHLIRPLGFDIDEKAVRRAGLDYWQALDLYVYDDFEEFLQKNKPKTLYMATTKASQTYTEVTYDSDAYIMFGAESRGIPEEILVDHPEGAIRIPMLREYRSLNLSNAVNIILFEALRQTGFAGMETQGQLHKLKWKTL